MKMLATILILLFSCNVNGFNMIIRTKIKFKDDINIKHFWKNTGFCPLGEAEDRADFLLSTDEKINIDFIGALPNEGVKMIRIHWLLDLIKVRSLPNKLAFNFELLDKLIQRLFINNLNPMFELMGNPSNYFYDFRKQSLEWSRLVNEIIVRYREIYGAAYLKMWRFELMNEPDLKLYNTFNLTLENYLYYFRASASAVKRLAGPAGLFRDNKKVHSLCWGLLDYCNSKSCSLDMITFHRKGDGIGSQVVERGVELINTLTSSYPNLKGIRFGNDEADITTGWSKPFEWRADVRYAALITQVVIGHINEMLVKRNIHFEMLSNDNAFLSFSPNYFTQRTLLARFQINNTSPPHVQFFKKPAYSVMALLSLLGNNVTDIRYQPGENGLSYLLTNRKFQEVLLGVIVNDKAMNETYVVDFGNYFDINVRIALGRLNAPGIYVVYIMNNFWNNPYYVWKSSQSPDFPDVNLRRRMRIAEGFRRLYVRRINSHQKYIKFILKDILVPSVFAISYCSEETPAPGPASDLRDEKVFKNEILLFWKDTEVKSRCILTYVVEYKASAESSFTRINTEDTIFLSYHFDGHLKNGSLIGVKGEYRVAAMDYWQRMGPFSNILSVVMD